MQIVKEEDDMMIVKDRSVLAFLIGIVVAIAGVAVIVDPNFFTNRPPLWSGAVSILAGLYIISVAKATTITLNKTTHTISVKWRELIGNKTREVDVADVKGIEVQTSYYSSARGGGGYALQLAFVLNNGEHIPLGSKESMRIMGESTHKVSAVGARMATFLNVPFEERRPPTVGEITSAVGGVFEQAIEKEEEKRAT